MKKAKLGSHFRTYLKSMLDDDSYKRLLKALGEGKAIIIKGNDCEKIKSVGRVLKQYGFYAFTENGTSEMHLDILPQE